MSDFYENDGTYSSDSWNMYDDPTSPPEVFYENDGTSSTTGSTNGGGVYYENDGTGTTTGGGFNNPNVGGIYYENDGTASTDTGAGGVGAGNTSAAASEAIKLINADTSGILKKLFTDKDGNLNLQALGGVGGGILGALGALRPDTKKVGYQGSIPKYDAVRNMVTAPPATVGGKPYRPGQGGINWGGDVSYVPKSTATTGGTTGGTSSKIEQDKNTAEQMKLYTPDHYTTMQDFGLIDPREVSPNVSSTMQDLEKMPPQQNLAAGGIAGLARGRYLQGGTDGMADKIPARIGKDQPAALSHGEFVIPADVVSHLGNGNSDAGAKKLYSMMDKIREARTGTKKQGKQINPDKFMPGGLAQAYAEGGAIKHYETGGSVSGLGAAANAGVTGSETAPNTWAGEYMSDMLAKGQALSNAPYQQYGGPLTAGASDLQNKVFTGLQGTNFPTNLGTSFSSAGAPTIGANGQPVGGGTSPAAQYMNPYLQSVLDPQLAEMRRQNQITNVGTNAKLTSAGAFGGGRQAIMNAENNRNMMQEMNKTVGQGYANAYDKAMNQFNTEQTQGMGLARFMADQGGQQRGIEAEGVAADKKAFEEARENPYKMVQYQQSLLNGLPIAANNIETAKNSTLQEAIKGAGGLAGMFPNKSNVTLADLTTAMKNLGFDL